MTRSPSRDGGRIDLEEVKFLAREISWRSWVGRTRTESNTSNQLNVERVSESPVGDHSSFDEDIAKCEVRWVDNGWDFVLKQRTYARAVGNVG